MPLEKWQEFRIALRVGVFRYGNIVTVASGKGVYKGQTEETFLLVLSLSKWDDSVRKPLHKALENLAKEYGQESITLTVGVPEFVGDHPE